MLISRVATQGYQKQKNTAENKESSIKVTILHLVNPQTLQFLSLSSPSHPPRPLHSKMQGFQLLNKYFASYSCKKRRQYSLFML